MKIWVSYSTWQTLKVPSSCWVANFFGDFVCSGVLFNMNKGLFPRSPQQTREVKPHWSTGLPVLTCYLLVWQGLNFSPWSRKASAPASWAKALLGVSLRVNRAQMLFPFCKCQEVSQCLATLIHLPCFVSALPLPTSTKSEPVEKQLEKIYMIEHCTLTVVFGENLSWDWKEHESLSKSI